MSDIFSNTNTCDIISTSIFDEEATHEQMILYTYVDNQTAQRLFKYYVGLRYNTTNNYKSTNPLQVPITLYETPETARLFATQSNTQLVAFAVNTENTRKYDEFDVAFNIKLKQAKNITLDEYKKQVAFCREKKKYNSYEYIVYTVRDKSIVSEIQLRDSK